VILFCLVVELFGYPDQANYSNYHMLGSSFLQAGKNSELYFSSGLNTPYGMETLNIIGCGRVGQCFGKIWSQRMLLEIDGLLSRTFKSAEQASVFLGQGCPTKRFEDLHPADYYMLSVPDDAIANSCDHLAKSGVLRCGAVVFHCSGSLSSEILAPAKQAGALVASVHPLKTVANAAHAAETFAGTPCGVEGDPAACQKLTRLLSASGGKVFLLKPEAKMLYHAGLVLACADLNALIHLSSQALISAGLPPNQALELIVPLARETLENISKFGSAKALTGPIARGDAKLIAKQARTVATWNPQAAVIYNSLGLMALQLAKEKGGLSTSALDTISESLKTSFTRTSTPPATPPKNPTENS